MPHVWGEAQDPIHILCRKRDTGSLGKGLLSSGPGLSLALTETDSFLWSLVPDSAPQLFPKLGEFQAT